MRVALCLVVVAACRPVLPELGPPPVPHGLAPDPVAGYRIFAHAHNDYQHRRPLRDALDAGFTSVEADIYLRNGKLIVSHFGHGTKGTLQDLYLDPLAAEVAAHGGSVYGDGVPFRLVIDIKENRGELPGAVDALLSGYPMISRYTDDMVIRGPVEVVFTGIDAMKRAAVAGSPRPGVRDSNRLAASDPPADGRWTDYALRWFDYLDWTGQGEMSPADRRALDYLVEDAHARQRKLRLFGTPDTESVWAAELEAGVDYINTDHLTELSRFLSERPRE